MMYKLFCVALVIMCSCDSQIIRAETPSINDRSIVSVQKDCNIPISWNVHFSPNGGATAYLVEAIGQAAQSVYIQAYSFTSLPITQALIAAKNRNVHVEVILDKSDKTGKGTMLPMMINNGLIVYIDDKHAIAHNKIIIIDKKIVFTGSFNFTNSAEYRNAENSIEITDLCGKLPETYQKNWQLHREHSVK